MKTNQNLLVIGLLSLFLLFPFFSFAQIPQGYYSRAIGKSGRELQDSLHEIIKNHVVISYDDPTAGPRIAANFIKKAKKTEIKGGALGAKYLSVKEVEYLAELPNKDAMIAQLLSVMNGVAAAFARVINAIKEQKEEVA